MKEVVTGDNYKQIVLKRMIILCWVLLAICFFVKLFGGNFFAFIGESKVAEYIANHLWLFSIVQFVFYFFGTFFVFSATYKDKHKILNIVSIVLSYTIKLLATLKIIPTFCGFIGEIIFAILIPIIVNNKKEWYVPIVLNILIIIFQVISLFTKNLGIVDFPYENVVAYVYMIDYYIMVVLMYLYLKRRNFNMTLGLWFLSNNKEQLEAYKDILVKKHEKRVAKHNKKINKIEERIAKC